LKKLNLHLADRAPGSTHGQIAGKSVVGRKVSSARRDAVKEIARLRESLELGNLADRARLDGFSHADRELLGNVNALVQALCSPLLQTSHCLERLGAGELPAHVDGSFPGGYAQIQSGLNKCIENMSRFAANVRHMAEEHAQGRQDAGMNASGTRGIFAEAAVAINELHGEHMAVAKGMAVCIEQFSKGNFDAPAEKLSNNRIFINENLGHLRTNLKALTISRAPSPSWRRS
jgi:methyl-accepting chemotaxis protein